MRPVRMSLLGLAALAIVLPGCSQKEPATATKSEPVTETKPFSQPAVGVYVTNETSGDLSIIDAGTQSVVATLKLGKRPRGIAAGPNGTTLYVALSGSPAAGPGVDESKLPPPDRSADGIGVVDIPQQTILKVLPGGTDPEQVTVSPDGTKVFAANEDASTASVIDTGSGQITETFKVGGEPEGVTVQPGGARVWVTSEEDAAVYVLDLKSGKVVKPVKVGPRPRSIAFLPDGSKAYVPSETGATLSVIDVKRLATVKTIDLGKGMRPMGTVVSPDGKFLYVSTGRSKMVKFIDTASDAVVGIRRSR